MFNVIPPDWYLILSIVLFLIGICGVLIRRNVLIILMCIELMLNAANLLLVAFSGYHGDINAQVFVFFIMIVAAAEVSVGLAIFTLIYRKIGTTDAEHMQELKW